MHTQEELDKAIIELYKEYKETFKDLKENNNKFFYDLLKMSKKEIQYTKDEVMYIGLNALALLEQDMKNNSNR